MLRIAGALLIILACVGAGRAFAARLERRRLLLAGTCSGLIALAKELEYSQRRMAEALTEAAQAAGAACELFESAAAELDNRRGITAGEAWRIALGNMDEPFTAEDLRILGSLSVNLGLSDSKNQLNLINNCRIRLEAAEREATLESCQRGRILRNLGVFAGVLTVLFFI